MDEDGGVKNAPVTRLRRRLSVEKPDEASSPAPLTPSKKRGGKLAAKPLLDNIDENVVVASPKPNRAKPLPKELEVIPETIVTPTKRTLRARSNSSISEIVTNVDTPRARRAARRNSQAGSDNEAVVTPNRVTRRTRSSISKDTPVTSPTIRQTRSAAITTPASEEKKDSTNRAKLNSSKDKVTPSPKSANKKKSTPSKTQTDAKEVSNEQKSQTPRNDSAIKRDTPVTSPTKRQTRSAAITTPPSGEEQNKESADMKDVAPDDNPTNNHINVNDANSHQNFIEFSPTSKNNLKISVHIEETSGDGSVSESGGRDVNKELGDQCVPVSNEPNHLLVEKDIEAGFDGGLNRDLLIGNNTNSSSSSDIKMTRLASKIINISGCEPMDVCDVTFCDTPEKLKNIVDSTNEVEEYLKAKIFFEDKTGNLSKQSLNDSNINKSINSKKSDSLCKTDVNLSNKSLNKSTNKSAIMDKSQNSPAKNSSIINHGQTDSVTNISQRGGTYSSDAEKNITANKSTLILSQIRDDSEIAVNNSKLSRSLTSSRKSDQNISESPCKSNVLTTSLDTRNTPMNNMVFKKSGVQTSTPVSITNMQNSKKHCNISKLENSRKDNSDSESDKDTNESSGLLDNEAQDESDEYKSGDSRNASEIEYERENEIVERGETLTSGGDTSNDTDYEKDSFVVSSDAEDDELLSGSGDDLALSDNELSMSKKSKLKYNEKKTKEQKKASREMYNARHSIKEGSDSSSSDDDDSKPKKKYNRQRLDSTLLKSGDEDVAPTTKGKINRLDSSGNSTSKTVLDTIVNNVSKTPNNSMNKSVFNENEISIINERGMIDKEEDPLSKINFKSEPITPMKNINISVVNVETRKDIEEVEVGQNVSIMKAVDTKDPLQETVNDFSSSSSDNEEILNNFDDMLMKLCENQKANLSLNSNDKKKKAKGVKILDELNITQSNTKKTKSMKNSSNTNSEIVNQSKKNIADEEVSTDSMDMRLIFQDSGDVENKEKHKLSEKAIEDTSLSSDISLNKSKRNNKKDKKIQDGDTHAVKNITMSQSLLGDIFKSPTNNQKSKSCIPDNTYDSMDHSNKFKLGSKNDKNNSEIPAHIEEGKKQRKTSFTGDNIEPILVENSKKKRRNKLSVSFADESYLDNSQAAPNITLPNDNACDTSNNPETSLTRSSKKKRKSLSESSEVTESTCLKMQQVLESQKKTKSKHKSISESSFVEDKPWSKIDGIIDSLRIKPDKTSNSSTTILSLIDENINDLSTESKKNKSIKLSVSSSDAKIIFNNDENYDERNSPPTDTGEAVVTLKNKKQKKLSESNIEAIDKDCLLGSAKKKQKKSLNQSNVGLVLQTAEQTTNMANEGKKKKRKHNASQSSLSNLSAHSDMHDHNQSTESSNKNNARNSRNIDVHSISDLVETSDLIVEGKRKKQKKVSESDSDKLKSPKNKQSDLEEPEDIVKSKNKKQKKVSEYDTDKVKSPKNKQSELEDPEDIVKSKNKKQKNVTDSATKEAPLSSPKKKSKKNYLSDSQNEDGDIKKSSSKKKHYDEGTTVNDVPEANETEPMLKTKRKRLDLSHQLSNDDEAPESNKTLGSLKKKQKIAKNEENDMVMAKSKKRKEREDHIPLTTKKATNENVTIARLPAAVLNQLRETPLDNIKRGLVSTSQFKVEETIKKANKPSNYLEESIYLDADSPIKKRHKKNRDIPKVLPFLPTVSTSHEGFTTQFKINVMPRETKFIAQPDSNANFKKDYLEQKIKKMRTYASYKKQRNIKLSKF